jgi:predicted  nucleic acid-binding Zn-ribbon protein
MRKANLSGEKNWEDIESFESLQIYEIMDTSDDAAAKAKYDSDMASINSQQKKLEYQLKQLDTEHQALVKELDSVLEVINNNIENSYNKFSS